MCSASIPVDYWYLKRNVPDTSPISVQRMLEKRSFGFFNNTFRAWLEDFPAPFKATGATMENCFLWSSCDLSPAKTPKGKIADELNSYLYLGYGWDGAEGVPASEKAVRNAVALLKSLPDEFPLPKPMIAGDGEVGFYWNEGGTFIDLEFSDNTIVNYYIRDANGREFFGEDQPLGSSIPADIFNCLKELK